MSKSTTKYGLTYAEGTDVPDIAYWTKALADAVEAALVAQGVSDTGWVLVPITDGRITSYAVGSEPRYRIKNGVCTFVGQITTTTAGLIDSGLTWATLPAEARPLYQVSTVQQGSGDDRWAMVVRANGQVTAERWGPTTSPANVWLPFTASWVVG